MGSYVYELNDSLYINLTNRCNNSCTFCIKFKNRLFEGQHDLWLHSEPSAEDVIKQIGDHSKYKHVVFCGYGEPLIKLDVLKKIASHLKEKGCYIRIDTDGQANLFHGRDILPDLKGLVDEINISLNAPDAGSYERLCRPVYGEKAYKSVLEFSALAKESIPKVVLTAVGLPGTNAEKCSAIADGIGIDFRLRPYYEDNYKA